jgi:hypothetical protein
MAASYNGDLIFGQSVVIQMRQNPAEQQLAAFFGLTGVFSLYGGGRGRVFLCKGTLIDTDPSGLSSQVGNILSYDDGIGRVLVDTWGNSWPAVVFRQFEPTGPILWVPNDTGGAPGASVEYGMIFEGRI